MIGEMTNAMRKPAKIGVMGPGAGRGRSRPGRRWWYVLLRRLAQSRCATLSTASGPSPMTGVALQVDSILADSMLKHAHIGAAVVSLTRGDTIYSRDAGRVFLPASNQKLLTGAAAATFGSR